MIRTKPALDPRRSEDGYRILIDPQWPRGLPKGKAAGVDWMKSLYPSYNLQDWMRRNPRKADGFRDRYLLELASKDKDVDKVCRMHRERGTVTILVVGAQDQWRIHDTLVRFLSSMCD